MVTPGCCCWYREKATLKNGASNVDPAPVRVGLWLFGPPLTAATADAGGPALVMPDVLHAPTARMMIAATVAQSPGCGEWRGRGPGGSWCPDMGCSSALR